jgi:hypothetical protein
MSNGKYVLLVCMYLNANVNESMVIITGRGLPYGTKQLQVAIETSKTHYVLECARTGRPEL